MVSDKAERNAIILKSTNMSQGTEQEIVNADKTIYNAYRAEIQQLGPDHTNYAAADRARMEKILRHILRAEGIARE